MRLCLGFVPKPVRSRTLVRFMPFGATIQESFGLSSNTPWYRPYQHLGQKKSEKMHCVGITHPPCRLCRCERWITHPPRNLEKQPFTHAAAGTVRIAFPVKPIFVAVFASRGMWAGGGLGVRASETELVSRNKPDGPETFVKDAGRRPLEVARRRLTTSFPGSREVPWNCQIQGRYPKDYFRKPMYCHSEPVCCHLEAHLELFWKELPIEEEPCGDPRKVTIRG